MADKRTPYEYQEHPKMLYMHGQNFAGSSKIVADAKDEAEARKAGYLKLGEKAPEPKVEPKPAAKP